MYCTMEKGIDMDVLALHFPHIFEQIVDYVIHTPFGTAVDRGYLVTARLYNHAWRDIVNRILRLRKQPLYTLTLDKFSCLPAVPFVPAVPQLGKLQRFESFLVTSANPALRSFRLIVDPDAFTAKTYEPLLSFLNLCGDHLQVLFLNVPENGGSLPGLMPNLSLPALHKFDCHLTLRRLYEEDEEEDDDDLPEQEALPSGPLNITVLLASILKAAVNLKTMFLWGERIHAIPSFHLLPLPASLTKVSLSVSNYVQLNLLTRYPLPNLVQLLLAPVSVPSDLLFRILEKCRIQLRLLFLEGSLHRGNRPSPDFRFPRMEALRDLEIIDFRMKRPILDLNAVMPKLRSLTLYEQTRESFSNWATVMSKPSPSLQLLSIALVNEEGEEVPPTVGIMARIHHSFPNLRELGLPVGTADTEVMRYIFCCMQQLQSLCIFVLPPDLEEDEDGDDIVGKWSWDSVLTGIPVEHLDEPQQKERQPSIRMLTELLKFSMVYIHSSNNNGPRTYALLSQVAYTHAFDQMPKLLHVSVETVIDDGEEGDDHLVDIEIEEDDWEEVDEEEMEMEEEEDVEEEEEEEDEPARGG